MPLIPYRAYEVFSPKTPVEVEAALRAVVEPGSGFGFFTRTALPFAGEVGAGTFRIRRVIRYRNSFLPQIRGTITAAPLGSRIGITMRLNTAVLVFVTFWLGGVGAGTIAAAVKAWRDAAPQSSLLQLLFMFVFGFALTVGGFTFEQRKAERLLAGILAAHT